MAFNNFPYTSFQDLNLDWVLRNVKTALLNSNDAVETANNLKNFVNTYFDDLDVQEEVNNKIDEMVESGEFLDIVDQVLPKRVLYVSNFSGENDNEKLQNAIDAALEMESCTLIIDETLHITTRINIRFTFPSTDAVQALVIQGIVKDVPTRSLTFHGDRNPTLRNNMIGCINCDVGGDGIVFYVDNRNDTSSLVVKDCFFWNETMYEDTDASWTSANRNMKLFYMNGCVCNFFNNTAVGFDYFIYSPNKLDQNPNKDNWTGDYARIENNTVYTNGHGIAIEHGDASRIVGNGFIALAGASQYLYMRSAHGFLMQNNMVKTWLEGSVGVNPSATFGIDLYSSNGLVIAGHGEDNLFPQLFAVRGGSVVTFIGNQHTTTHSGYNVYVDQATAILYGNHFDTNILRGSNAVIITDSDITTMMELTNSLTFQYVATAADWDTYTNTTSFAFNNLTTTIRTGYVRGFFESKFKDDGTIGVQEITWIDGKKSCRTCWYGAFSQWVTES